MCLGCLYEYICSSKTKGYEFLPTARIIFVFFNLPLAYSIVISSFPSILPAKGPVS